MNIQDDTGKLYYIGGCVRDELLNIKPLDTDICFEGDAIEYVKNAGYEIVKIQNDIRTARVLISGKEIDFASSRKEIYPKPGHLPVTTEIGCPIEDDLLRRDFTVNSIAKSVKTGEIIDPSGGIKDLKSGLLRVHHKNSFRDDPTRILRALKFSIRLGFRLEDETKKLQNEYLANVDYDMSYSRLKKELVDTFNLNSQVGFERFINEKIYKLLVNDLPPIPSVDIEALVNEFSIKTPWLIYVGWLDLSNIELTRQEKNIINDYRKLKFSPHGLDNFELYKLCHKMDIQSVILGVIAGDFPRGLEYLRNLRGIELGINGKDLIQLGIAGRRIGEILDEILAVKLKNPDMTQVEELNFAKKYLELNNTDLI